MADTKISALTDGNPAQSGDEIPIARSGANYKITAGSIASLGGDVDGPASAVDSQIALFNSTTGKLIKAATTTGLLKASSGVIAAATSGTDYAPATTGTNAQLLANNGSGGFSNVTVGSNLTLSAGTLSATGGLAWQSVQTTGFTAVAGRAYPCNTTSAAITVTLPASPSAGDQITLTDYAGTFSTNNLTINPNGGKIRGSTDNAAISTSNNSVQLVYVDSTQGWLVYSAVTSSPFLPAASSIDLLVVAGGGAGGGTYGGGGGGGGMRESLAVTVSEGVTYTITVGNGGTGGTGAGGDGGFSSIAGAPIAESPAGAGTNTFKAYGGGGGGDGSAATTGRNGGSGGGGGVPPSGTTPGGSGNTPSTTPSQGAGGGGGGRLGGGGGGGGGASGVTGSTFTAPFAGGAGGNGSSSSLIGSATSYAGGGGGTSWSGGPAAGGAGGGGAGSVDLSSPGGAGTANLGGGGGGGNPSGGNGGKGVVIIRYPDTKRTATTTGSPTVTTSGGYRIYKFTGNGTILF
jgi:hypothetical protein